MAWAIFTERFLYDRRPRQGIAFDVKPSTSPQSLPRDVIDAAIAAGKAKTVKTPRPEQRRALRSRKAGE